MGTVASKLSLTLFELLNELHIALGSGLWGIGVLLHHGLRSHKYGGTLCLCSITLACLMYLLHTEELLTADVQKLVVITGCDSGLGYSMALHLQDRGFRVLAGCLDLTSVGTRQLVAAGVQTFELNVTNVESVHNAVRYVHGVLQQSSQNELWALINNAGVMVFAEFEWQTDELMFDQINVNLIGNMRMTKGFAPLLRQYQARLINVSSHCAIESLPGLAVYGASKSAIKGLTDSLRVELGKYGVRVISLIPGSFPTQSNILAKQMDYVYEMRSSFTREQEEFYGDYFQRYNSYLSAIATPSPARRISNPDLYRRLEHALLARKPAHTYKIEPLRYCIYHALFRVSPVCLRDYFVEMFVRMPKYKKSKRQSTSGIETVMRVKSTFDASSNDRTMSTSWEEPRRYDFEGGDGVANYSSEVLQMEAAPARPITAELRAPNDAFVSSSQGYA